MVGIFVRLKLRLLRNRLGVASGWSVVGFILIWLAALGAGGIGILVLGLVPRLAPDLRPWLPVAGFNLIAVMWVVVPVVAASIDDQLDPRRFELLPLGRFRLGAGLLAAGMIGPGALATVVGLVGGSLVGYADLASAVPIAAATAVGAVLVMAVGRWLTTLFSDLLRSRRSQEVSAVAFGLLMGAPGIASALIASGTVSIPGGPEAGLLWLALTPPGALGRAVVVFSHHQWLVGIGGLGYGLVSLVVVIGLLGLALERLQTRAPSAGRTRRADAETAPLVPGWLPPGPVGVMAAKEVRYLRRDPRVRTQLMGGAIALVVLSVSAGRYLFATPYGPFLSVAVAFFLTAPLAPNRFGFDGGSFWGYLTTVQRWSDVLRGKNLGLAVVIIPGTVLAAGLGAMLSARFEYLAAGILTGIGWAAVMVAVGNVASVMGAYPLSESNLFGSRHLSGTAALVSLLDLLAAGVLLVPIVALVGIPAWLVGPGWATLGSLAGLGYAGGLYLASLRVSEPLLANRALRLREVLDER